MEEHVTFLAEVFARDGDYIMSCIPNLPIYVSIYIQILFIEKNVRKIIHPIVKLCKEDIHMHSNMYYKSFNQALTTIDSRASAYARMLVITHIYSSKFSGPMMNDVLTLFQMHIGFKPTKSYILEMKRKIPIHLHFYEKVTFHSISRST